MHSGGLESGGLESGGLESGGLESEPPISDLGNGAVLLAVLTSLFGGR